MDTNGLFGLLKWIMVVIHWDTYASGKWMKLKDKQTWYVRNKAGEPLGYVKELEATEFGFRYMAHWANRNGLEQARPATNLSEAKNLVERNARLPLSQAQIKAA